MIDAVVPVQAGDTLANKYRVDRVLGSGGMGVVVAATHVELGQRVALKFLLPNALLNGEAVARFLREARAAVKIDSEHVARVSDVGRLENGAPFMVMEYLEGIDLASSPKGADLPIEHAVNFVLQASEAIAVAHALGIVHRDLKPANLFLTARADGVPLIKVLDFGISKLLEPQVSPELTRSSAVMGSPLYMSPEQMRSSRNVDVRTDVWALGAILYELLTGVPPFSGETLGEVFAAVMTTEPRPVRELRPDAPEQLEYVVKLALEKDLARRFANVGAFVIALREFATGESIALIERVQATLDRAGVMRSAPPPSLPPAQSLAPAAATDPSWATPARTQRSSTAILLGVASLAGLIAVGALLHKVMSSPAATEPTAAALTATAAAPVAPVVAASHAVEAAPLPSPNVVPVASAEPPIASAAPHPAASVRPPQRPRAEAAAAPSDPAQLASSPSVSEPKRKNPMSIDFK